MVRLQKRLTVLLCIANKVELIQRAGKNHLCK